MTAYPWKPCRACGSESSKHYMTRGKYYFPNCATCEIKKQRKPPGQPWTDLEMMWRRVNDKAAEKEKQDSTSAASSFHR